MMNETCKKEMLAGLFLSKFSKEGLAKLGFKNYVTACRVLAQRVGGNWLSIRNYRDEFDPVFPNGRKGYYQRPMMPSRKAMLDELGDLGIDDMAELLIEQFFGTEAYVAKLNSIMEGATEGKEVSIKVGKVKLTQPELYLPEGVDVSSAQGKERLTQTRVRINQSTFRKWVVANYQGQCCITGLDIVKVLEAGHISGWDCDIENRMNPSNGICLSATYHKAFDAHLISFDDDYRLVLSPSLKECCTHEIHKEYFLAYEGVKMRMPIRFLPDKTLLADHLKSLVS